MKHLDKILMVLLIVGVWALVLKPTSITAHTDMRCSLSGSAHGLLSRGITDIEVEIKDWRKVRVNCR